MNSPLKRFALVGLGIASLAVSGTASANYSTWYSYGSSSCGSGGSSSGGSSSGGACPSGEVRTEYDFNNGTLTYPSDPSGSTVSVTGWVAPSSTATSTDANTEFNNAQVNYWSGNGLGVGGEGYPEHAIDNKYGLEFLLLSFSEALALCDLQIGWPDSSVSYDSDMTILAYTGAGMIASNGGSTADDKFYDGFQLSDMNYLNSDTGDSDLSGTRGLTQAGWQLIGNPNDIDADTWTSIGNAGNVASSYWLVGTRNNFLGSNVDGYDYAKLLAVRTCCDESSSSSGGSSSGGVPEPATLAMAGLGFVGIRWSRRWTNRKQKA